MDKDSHKSGKVSVTPSRKTYQICPGAIFIIGKPVNKTYLYLSTALSKETLNPALHLPPTKLIGQSVVVASVLKISDGSQICVLSRTNNKDFYPGLTVLYAWVDNAIIGKELLLP